MLIGVAWQTAFVALPIYIVVKDWRSGSVSAAIIAATSTFSQIPVVRLSRNSGEGVSLKRAATIPDPIAHYLFHGRGSAGITGRWRSMIGVGGRAEKLYQNWAQAVGPYLVAFDSRVKSITHNAVQKLPVGACH